MHVACTMSLSFYIQDWPPFLLFFIYVINCNNFNLMNIKFHSYRFWNYPICFCCFFFVFFNNVLYFIQMLNTATFHSKSVWMKFYIHQIKIITIDHIYKKKKKRRSILNIKRQRHSASNVHTYFLVDAIMGIQKYTYTL
jgi:hypothetical protein